MIAIYYGGNDTVINISLANIHIIIEMYIIEMGDFLRLNPLT
jgi:hypothetical protein